MQNILYLFKKITEKYTYIKCIWSAVDRGSNRPSLCSMLQDVVEALTDSPAYCHLAVSKSCNGSAIYWLSASCNVLMRSRMFGSHVCIKYCSLNLFKSLTLPPDSCSSRFRNRYSMGVILATSDLRI